MATSSSPALSTAPASFERAHVSVADTEHGIKTIPELIEFNARENGDVVFAIQAFKTGKTMTLSHRQLKQAILNCRRHLTETVVELQQPVMGADGTFVKGAPIALLGESNALLLMYMLTMVSMGVPVLLLSTRLSPLAVRHLLIETKAVAIIASARMRVTAAQIAVQNIGPATQPLPIYDQMSSNLLLEDTPQTTSDTVHVPGYYLNEADRSVLILHSSGTTGMPKAIYASHRYLLSFTTCHELPYNGRTEQLCLSTLPLYHGFGLIAPLLSMGVGMPFCIPPSSSIPTGASIAGLLGHTGATTLTTVPSILEEISLLPGKEGVDILSGLNLVCVGGGQLKQSVGETLSSAGVRLINHYGTTESGPLTPLFVPGPDYDHRYFRLRKDIKLQIDTALDGPDGTPRFTLTTFPPGWEAPFPIQDQLVQNPSFPGSDFNAVGRNDAVVVLATGEKVLPSILETRLLEDERLCTAITFGDGHFEIGIIVQPGPHVVVHSPEAFKQEIWPVIERANAEMDAQGRVSSLNLVIYVPSYVVLPRSDKGSILRRDVIKQFETEISDVYQRLEERVADSSTTRLNMDTVEDQLQEYIQNSLGWRVAEGLWSRDDDLFEIGMDSLQALQLRRHLLGAIRQSKDLDSAAALIPQDFVYRQPSVAQMAKALRGGMNTEEDSSTIDKLVEEFRSIAPTTSLISSQDEFVVLLTGSTGSLGAHILAKLAALPSVSRIICLLRPRAGSHPVIRLRESLAAKGLAIPSCSWSRIEAIETDTAKPHLGLSNVWHAELRSSLTHILHAAWPMDFKRKVHSFRDAFHSLQNLLLVARQAREYRPHLRPRLLFVSSIAVVGQYCKVTGDAMVPEAPMPGNACANHIGYAQAKFICERMLEDAAKEAKGHLEVAYVRVGQMSGSSETGFWNDTEHIPALVAASRTIGRLPDLRGTLSWIPVDHAAAAILDILHTSHPLTIAYHLEDPIRRSWNDVLTRLSAALNLTMASVLPMPAWIAAVRALPAPSLQAVKLADFFELDFEHMACGAVVLDTYQTRLVSPTLRRLSAVSTYNVQKYITWWQEVGIL